MPFIDAHSHVWTPDTEKYPLAAGFKKEGMKPPSWTPEELMAHASAEGVDRVVLIQMSFYGFDNRYMLDQMKRFPGKFSGVAVIDWTAARPDEDMSKMAREGVRGFRVRALSPPYEKWAETPSLERMFRFAADHDLAICPLLTPEALPSLSRMCAKHPKTRVVIDHLARVGFGGEVKEPEVDALCKMAQHPEVRVKVSAFYALGKGKAPYDDLVPVIRRVHGAFGAKRLMWATDCPFQVVNGTYRGSIALIRDGCPWMSKDDKDWLLRRSAETVFFW